MSKDARFWRNVVVIGLAHVLVLVGLVRWSLATNRSPNTQSIVWITGRTEDDGAASPHPAMGSPPPPEPSPLKPDEMEEEKPFLAATKSEIELPTPKPTPTTTPTPKPTATPKPTPKRIPEPTPKPSPKKTVLTKALPKPSPKSDGKKKEADTETKKKTIAKIAPAQNTSSSQSSTEKKGSAGKGEHAGGGNSDSEFGWYGNMLHDRFYSAWVQPTTNVPSGASFSILVKIRIEKDGRVSNFEIIKPSENVVVNESVASIAKRVTQVDPLPAGLGSGDHYDVKINFELNSEP
jgi:TonB family protein